MGLEFQPARAMSAFSIRLSTRHLSLVLLLTLCPACGGNRGDTMVAGFPSKPIRLVLPYGPGGATDIVARVIADYVHRVLGQPVVFEYKPGASGVVAISEVVGSKADGYTLLLGNITTNLLNPIIGESPLPFDAFTRLVPLARLVSIPGVLITTTVDFPPTTLKELLQYARERPGELNYSTSGILAYSHIDWLLLQQRAGVRLVDVPTRAGAGAGGAQVDIITGRIHASIQNAATVMPFVKAGQVRALAVSGEHRLAAYPDVPTFEEEGFAGIGTSGWQALFAPAGAPAAALDRITGVFRDALADEGVRRRLSDLQVDIVPTRTADDARTWLDGERRRWTPIVATAKALHRDHEASLAASR
jgi:tripartite-type tricarboxylate transporter receptor subunit TctC